MATVRQTMEIKIMTRTIVDKAQDSISQQRPILKNNEEGQAAIEFILTFAFGIGIVMLFVSLAMNMTRGYLVHYANFMASRTFLTYDSNSINDVETSIGAARVNAVRTFNSYPLANFGIEPQIKVNTPSQYSSLMSGTTATFVERMTPFSLVGGTNEATFHSESFLTKEPVRLQCMLSTCEAMGIQNCASALDVTVFDNGC